MDRKTAMNLWDQLVADINDTPSPFAIAAIANGVTPVNVFEEFNWQEASDFLRKFADALGEDKSYKIPTHIPSPYPQPVDLYANPKPKPKVLKNTHHMQAAGTYANDNQFVDLAATTPTLTLKEHCLRTGETDTWEEPK